MNPSRPLVRRPWRRPLLSCLALAFALATLPAAAQETVVPKRNVRTGYAQVLRVEPVYQTLTATRMEQRCDGKVVAPKDPPRGLSRIVGAVKDALGGDKDKAGAATPAAGSDCQLVPVERKFQRPIAYDVDYVFRGMKYRSRLPYDPGNRLRVQFSLQPVVPDAR
ncbi:MAG: hypothetical protein ACTHOC_06320 [Luteimonas sp.]